MKYLSRKFPLEQRACIADDGIMHIITHHPGKFTFPASRHTRSRWHTFDYHHYEIIYPVMKGKETVYAVPNYEDLEKEGIEIIDLNLFSNDTKENFENFVAENKLDDKYKYHEAQPALIEKLIQHSGITPQSKILEPCAGEGAIIAAIHASFPKVTVDCYEIHPRRADRLKKFPCAKFISNDFLYSQLPTPNYTTILIHPPLNLDSDFIIKAYSLLAAGGKVVALALWRHGRKPGRNEKEKEFEAWLKDKKVTLDESLWKKKYEVNGFEGTQIMVITK